MKTNILKITLFGFAATMGMISCQSPEQKIENAEQKVEEANINVAVANKELEQARIDSANGYTAFRKEAEIKLNKNDKKIIELKEKFTASKKETREKYDKQLNDLDKKNAELRKEIVECKRDDKTKWELFKESVNNDIDKLGKSLSAMAEANMNKK